jgi:hypothetical protein
LAWAVEAAERKVVLTSDVDADAIDDLATAAGWQLTNIVPEGPRRPAQRIFSTNGGDSAVYFVSDARLGVTYAAASGLEAEALLDRVAAELRSHRADEIVLDGDLERIRVGLAVLALAGVPPKDEIVARLAEVARSDDASVRSAVLTAITYAPWPAFAAIVEGFQGDPEPALRQAAAQIQAAFPSLAPSPSLR